MCVAMIWHHEGLRDRAIEILSALRDAMKRIERWVMGDG